MIPQVVGSAPPSNRYVVTESTPIHPTASAASHTMATPKATALRAAAIQPLVLPPRKMLTAVTAAVKAATQVQAISTTALKPDNVIGIRAIPVTIVTTKSNTFQAALVTHSTTPSRSLAISRRS